MLCLIARTQGENGRPDVAGRSNPGRRPAVDRLTLGKLTGGKLADGKLVDGKLVDGMLADAAGC